MKRFLIMTLLAAAACAGFSATAQAKDSRCYEMRVYYAAAGKLDELHARFRNHTLKLFEKHGITNVGYWVPIENPETKLIYILSYPSREAREQSWKAFMADPDWQKAYKASEVNGKLVDKVEVTFMTATDYSPEIMASKKEPRVFELRTYTATPGKLGDLNARFRDHTVKLFAKHGMTNFGYWTPAEKEKGAEDTLIYLLAHASKEAAGASFKNFGGDPTWQAAKKASEEKAGGSLTVNGGVKSVFMTATDYSPTK
ncbi:MAG: NIPSNAP family protein [Verrucomicrobia bacterium]|nr:NIPSNAP family protein [Verrucomicrobiota bacterium]